ncbi:hypothetical protein AnigIFM63604_007935 [Aspergillus niger]|uniref:Rhodopsin domain-containing protein n=1 Tax=Aspergillus niger TaxID=5061 RepID=A0A9W5ZW83_ASPNG|nr:hypothetical protein AnigIFM63604_007935 [Aspergillus niger]
MTAVSSEYAHQTKGPRILAVFWTMTSLAILAVAARLFIRIKVLRNPGADDWLIATSMTRTRSASQLYQLRLGHNLLRLTQISRGCPAEPFSESDNDTTRDLVGIDGVCGTGVVYLHLGALYHVRSSESSLGHVPSVKGRELPELMDPCGLCHLHWSHICLYGSVFGNLSDSHLTKASYVAAETIGVVCSVGSECSVSKNSRSSSSSVFAKKQGYSACAMAIIKCMQLPGLADLSDTTYATADLVIWTSIESNVVILASCIPTLQPLLEIILGKRSLRSTGGYQYKESSTQLPESSKWSSKRSGHRKSKGNMMIADIGSQDSILQIGDDHEDESHYMGHIHRTDKITVVYESVTPQPGGADKTNDPVK